MKRIFENQNYNQTPDFQARTDYVTCLYEYHFKTFSNETFHLKMTCRQFKKDLPMI